MKRLLKIILGLIGLSLGVTLFFFLQAYGVFVTGFYTKIIYIILFAAAGFLSFYFISPFFIKTASKISANIEKESSKFTTGDIISGLSGLIIGLIIAFFISGLIQKIPVVGGTLAALLYVMLGYMGIVIVHNKKDDFSAWFKKIQISKREKTTDETKIDFKAEKLYKILDTSVLIDGRILDIVKSGFIEGRLIVPNFVLDELRHIADSSDDLKRTKGRRGLDILKQLQSTKNTEVYLDHTDFSNIEEVDMKLLSLAEKYNGKVLTNDFNLNKVAGIKGVHVLNINELANALKAILLPGETLRVNIVKEGKENSQGLAYLDDGTMIVVEGGRKSVGKDVDVMVTSALQTSAGRMIFAKIIK